MVDIKRDNAKCELHQNQVGIEIRLFGPYNNRKCDIEIQMHIREVKDAFQKLTKVVRDLEDNSAEL